MAQEPKASSGPLETLQTQIPHHRRLRPPDLQVITSDDQRVPLKPETKLGRRESRLGLRGLFGRAKTGKDVDVPPSPSQLSKPGGIRASWCTSKPELPTGLSPSTAYGAWSRYEAQPALRPVRSSVVATWEPPPLFQAYPQALRHAQLPACTHSADTILRLSDKRNAQNELDAGDDISAAERRRKHRRNLSNMLEWTTKIYVLVTSGYLLQYSGKGLSTAFLKEYCTLERDPRLLPAMLFRADTGAEDMDAWLTMLRREIEGLGGKRHLSETGKPKPNDPNSEIESQQSQRTLVVRDPTRFSRVIQPDEVRWQRDRAETVTSSEDAEGSVTVVEALTPEQSTDDLSTTNSVVSHDGRQLDSLRDSTGANRLSYISSGQRTIITSAGSSPACSPTRDTFANHFDDTPIRDPVPEVRLRPNAAAIADRRQSMQTIHPFIDPLARPHSTYTSSPLSDPTAMYGPTTPNFSVPHGVSRRYSLVKPSIVEAAAQSPPLVPEPPHQQGLPSLSEIEPPQHSASTAESSSPSLNEPTIVVNISPPPLSPPAIQAESMEPPSNAQSEGSGKGMDTHERSLNVTPPRKAASMQALRASMDGTLRFQDSPTPSLPIQSNVEAAEAHAGGHLSVDKSQAILNRRSMPQLVEGPPPAPPPTCALPPIPQKRVKV
ncbi:unnamed protein product [Parascedosporium putredinis]|uniref:PH domain-containing protein n=1 Tax=Parascedosporium putredinis TaxID=1442378 RepID=A0A9P1H6J9_9PEZI|nr:unnamed protein product [Parascedosporium putredinis]CAI7998771.1 unnamed protein product [Parascedosporium putredinis]